MDVCGTPVKKCTKGRGGGCVERKKRRTEERTDGRTDEDGDDDGGSIVLFASSMGGRVSVDIIVIDGVDSVDVGVGVDV